MNKSPLIFLYSFVSVIVVSGLIVIGSRQLGCYWNRYTSVAAYADPYLLLVRHSAGRGGGAMNHCLKVVDVRNGNLLVRKLIPADIDERETVLTNESVMGVTANGTHFFRYDLSTDRITLTDIDRFRDLVPDGQRMELVPERGMLRIMDLAGLWHEQPIPGATPESVVTAQPFVGLDSVRIPPTMRAPLLDAKGNVIKEDIGLVFPIILRHIDTPNGIVVIVLSYETIEKKRWVLTALNALGDTLWQVTQRDVAERGGGGLLASYANPKYSMFGEGAFLLILQMLVLRVDVSTGQWELFSM
ncbi:MAG: hypothetical protein AAB668_00380 [Patescibacteria group bacterium]